MLRNFFCRQVKTVKILKFYFTDEKNALNSHGMCSLALSMHDGSTQYVESEPRRTFKKYRDIFDNPMDENYKHNRKIIYDYDKFRLYDGDIIPMPENPPYTKLQCRIS